jgi:hypothetical protein
MGEGSCAPPIGIKLRMDELRIMNQLVGVVKRIAQSTNCNRLWLVFLDIFRLFFGWVEALFQGLTRDIHSKSRLYNLYPFVIGYGMFSTIKYKLILIDFRLPQRLPLKIEILQARPQRKCSTHFYGIRIISSRRKSGQRIRVDEVSRKRVPIIWRSAQVMDACANTWELAFKEERQGKFI